MQENDRRPYADREVLTLREAAGLLRVCERTLRTRVAEGSIPFSRVGRVLRFRRSRLMEWFDNGCPVPRKQGRTFAR